MKAARPITLDLVPSAARLLADAFFTNPAHTYICPDSELRSSQLEWLLGSNLKSQPDLRASFCLIERDAVLAMGFWTRSTTPSPGFLAKVRAGLLASPARLGLAGLRRVFEVTRAIDDQLEHTLEDQPFWYLNNMAVQRHLRGCGIGSRLLGEQLRVVSGIEPTFAVALSTQRPENVKFYERFGFRVARDSTVGTGFGAFRNWTMVCAPAA